MQVPSCSAAPPPPGRSVQHVRAVRRWTSAQHLLRPGSPATRPLGRAPTTLAHTSQCTATTVIAATTCRPHLARLAAARPHDRHVGPRAVADPALGAVKHPPARHLRKNHQAAPPPTRLLDLPPASACCCCRQHARLRASWWHAGETCAGVEARRTRSQTPSPRLRSACVLVARLPARQHVALCAAWPGALAQLCRAQRGG